MTAHELLIWRLRFVINYGLVTQEGAARALGISRRLYQYYEAGERPIPRTIVLACCYLTEHHEELENQYYN